MSADDFMKVGDAANDISLIENEITSDNKLVTTLTKADGTSIESEPVSLPSGGSEETNYTHTIKISGSVNNRLFSLAFQVRDPSSQKFTTWEQIATAIYNTSYATTSNTAYLPASGVYSTTATDYTGAVSIFGVVRVSNNQIGFKCIQENTLQTITLNISLPSAPSYFDTVTP